jgi:hypothetical protein
MSLCFHFIEMAETPESKYVHRTSLFKAKFECENVRCIDEIDVGKVLLFFHLERCWIAFPSMGNG